jgi:hypothetical protein
MFNCIGIREKWQAEKSKREEIKRANQLRECPLPKVHLLAKRNERDAEALRY